MLVDGRRGLVLALLVPLDRRTVVGAPGDRLFEDHRIRRDAAYAIVLHQPRELAALEKVTPDVIQPYRLAVGVMKLLYIHGVPPRQ